MAVCPKCGSNRFHYEVRSAGSRSTTYHYRRRGKGWFFPSGKSVRSSVRRHKRIGICPNCGYVEDFEGTAKAGCFIILVIFVAIIGITEGGKDFLNRNKKTVNIDKPKTMLNTTYFETKTAKPVIQVSPDLKNSTSVWAENITPIEDFDYYIDGEYIFLKRYEGKAKKVRIGTEYTVGGKVYHLADSVEGLFVASNVSSVILPEGIRKMANNIFNSCGVKYMYLPKSLETDISFSGFYRYLHDAEEIYYGGSEDDWHRLTNNAERSRIDVTRIIYNAVLTENGPEEPENTNSLSGNENERVSGTNSLITPSPTVANSPTPLEFQSGDQKDLTSLPTETIGPKTFIGLMRKTANVRAEPRSDSKLIGTAKQGERITILQPFYSEKWHKVIFNGVECFISSNYCILQE